MFYNNCIYGLSYQHSLWKKNFSVVIRVFKRSIFWFTVHIPYVCLCHVRLKLLRAVIFVYEESSPRIWVKTVHLQCPSDMHSSCISSFCEAIRNVFSDKWRNSCLWNMLITILLLVLQRFVEQLISFVYIQFQKPSGKWWRSLINKIVWRLFC